MSSNNPMVFIQILQQESQVWLCKIFGFVCTESRPSCGTPYSVQDPAACERSHSLRKQGGISSVTLHFSSFILSSSASADLIWFAETNWEIMRPKVVIYSGGIWRRQCGDSTASYEFGSNWSCWIGPNGWKVMSMASKSLIYASKNTKKFQHF